MRTFQGARWSLVNIKRPTLRNPCAHITLDLPCPDFSRCAELNNKLPRVTAVNGRIEVGQTITVSVGNLSNWAIDNDPWHLVPYLNSILIHMYPEQANLSENQLLFHLERTLT
jgi:hypothetical protein